jgi:sensor c-di-GMP phosphodiesterase-like protein
MDGATEVLIIILSVVLTIFLLVSIVAAVLLIKLTRTLHRMADKAEHVVDNVESAATAFKNAAGPLAVGKFLVNIAESVIKKKKGKG